MKERNGLFAFLLILFCSHHAFTQEMVVSGELTDLDGNPVGAATPFITDVVDTMYNTEHTGYPLYTETFLTADSQGVSVKDGIFTLTLGHGTTSDDLVSLFKRSDNLRIEIVIDGDVLS